MNVWGLGTSCSGPTGADNVKGDSTIWRLELPCAPCSGLLSKAIDIVRTIVFKQSVEGEAAGGRSGASVRRRRRGTADEDGDEDGGDGDAESIWASFLGELIVRSDAGSLSSQWAALYGAILAWAGEAFQSKR